VGYPNEAERTRLECFPDRIAVEDLRACFALSDRDRVLIFEQRGAENRLGLAISLCALRFLGFVPDDIASIPDEVLAFVAAQVDATEVLQLDGNPDHDPEARAAAHAVDAKVGIRSSSWTSCSVSCTTTSCGAYAPQPSAGWTC
jgi:hypothetical protein